MFTSWENQGSASLMSCLSLSSRKGNSVSFSDSRPSALPSKEQEMNQPPVGQLAHLF